MGGDPDLVSIFVKAGKGIRKIFRSKKSEESVARPTMPGSAMQAADHRFSYGVVYANEIAAREIEKSARNFPIGSIIVRERLDSIAATAPTAVIAMVKREKGFSSDTGDWEFFMLNGADLKLTSRQTVGNCSACHTEAKSTDWVFLDHLKK